MNVEGIIQNPQMYLLLFAVIASYLHFTFHGAAKLWNYLEKPQVYNHSDLLCIFVVSLNLKDPMLHFLMKD